VSVSAPFAAPVPPSVIAVSPVGDDETLTGVSLSPVEEDEGPHAINDTPTINAKNTFFIIAHLMINMLYRIKKLYQLL
jgi:hypothetical protein